MSLDYLRSLYSLDGQAAVVTGRTGVLRRGMAMALAMAGALVWLCGPGARFVNRIVVAVDGGFSAFSAV